MLNGEEKFSWGYNDDEWNDVMVEHKLGRCRIKMCCCNTDGHMRRSKLGTRHFFHASNPGMGCNYKKESDDHLRMKETIAKIALLYTPMVKTEYEGPNWTADVYCEYGRNPIVFEVQLSRITIADLKIRDSKYIQLGIESHWLIPAEKKIPGLNVNSSSNKVLRFTIDEHAQDVNNRYVFNGRSLLDVIKSIFDMRVNKRIKEMEEYQAWLKTNPLSMTSIKPTPVKEVDESYKLIPEEPCINLGPDKRVEERRIIQQPSYISKFEQQCIDQSKWETDQGKWKYTRMSNGLIIPTYDP